MKIGNVLSQFVVVTVCMASGLYAQAQGGVSDSANSQRIRYGVSAATNTTMAVISLKGCNNPVTGPMMCTMGVAAIAQAGLDLVGLASSKKICQQTGTCGGTPNFPTPTPDPNGGNTYTYEPTPTPATNNRDDKDPRNNEDPYDPETLGRKIGEIENAYRKQGYEIKPDGSVKTPKGIATPAMLGSGQALANAGLLDPSQVATYDKMLKEHSNKILTITGASSGGGGSRAAGPRAAVNYDSGVNPAMFGKREEPKAAATTGLSKNFGNDPVGIATDDLFQMVHRRYRSLDERKTFVAE